MKTVIGSLAIAVALAGLPAPADAKGCIKGALVGGVAGHYAGHHGLLGAAAGCIVGRHEANKAARQKQDAQRHPVQDSTK
jgi:uncharacterized protein YcfJ